VTTIGVASTWVPDEAAALDPATQAEERFLAELRQRVAWQSERAAALRAAAADPVADLRDLAALWRLVESRPDAPRAAEWRSFLIELRDLADESGRLPEFLERLVRVVLADLL
jgi:hypothetical protein